VTPLDPPRPRWQRDIAAFAVLIAGLVLLAAPAGLLWSAVAPRYTVERKDSGIEFPNIESTKAFVGADGTYVVILLVLGLLTGLLAWRFGKQYGPATVLGLAVGGLLGAWIAARVGLMPGRTAVMAALGDSSTRRGPIDLYLGVRDQKTGDLALRGAWGAVAWPVGSLVAFLSLALRRPELLD
jgi:hypothetical protein